jgi:hypothetical protein
MQQPATSKPSEQQQEAAKPTAREEQQEAKERSSPSSKVIHEAILREGQDELSRSSDALLWSGLAAGLSMGLSMIAEGV